MPKTIIVIPAREGSTRFPNKPMAKILGVSVLERTWKIARAVNSVSDVIIATDSREIQTHALNFGAKVVMTRPDCENGTLRMWEAMKSINPKPAFAINLQADAVLTPPWVIDKVVAELHQNPKPLVTTPATQLSWKQFDQFQASRKEGKTGGTLVVFDKFHDALYFSKGTIPAIRNRAEAEKISATAPIFRHIGLYGYSLETLERYANLEPGALEQLEQLEQLRLLENGIKIRVVEVDYRSRTHWSIDNPEDIEKTEAIILTEGELV